MASGAPWCEDSVKERRWPQVRAIRASKKAKAAGVKKIITYNGVTVAAWTPSDNVVVCARCTKDGKRKRIRVVKVKGDSMYGINSSGGVSRLWREAQSYRSKPTFLRCEPSKERVSARKASSSINKAVWSALNRWKAASKRESRVVIVGNSSTSLDEFEEAWRSGCTVTTATTKSIKTAAKSIPKFVSDGARKAAIRDIKRGTATLPLVFIRSKGKHQYVDAYEMGETC